jgi:pimeloyl-ACP methyl ester carboxylesterase
MERPMLESSLPHCAPTPFHVVFLHGAGTGPWIWEAARQALPHPSVALEVPSNRERTNPERCAQELLSHHGFPSHGPVVLVLHSLAGVLETALVRSLGDRAVHVVHVASVAPRPGRSFASTMGFPASLVLPVLFRFQPRGLLPSPAMLVNQLGNDLPDSLRAKLVERHRPEFPGLFLEPVGREAATIPRSYIHCLKDHGVSPRLQEKIAERLGAAIFPIDAGHMPMLSRSAEFVAILERILAGLDTRVAANAAAIR